MRLDTYFYASQRAWIQDDSPLKLCLKSRQTGFSFANAFRLVSLVSALDARLKALRQHAARPRPSAGAILI